MTRIIVAGVLGSILYFIWGMATWTAIPLHMPTLAGLPDESAVTAALKDQDLDSGVYVSPWSDNAEDWSDADSDWMKNHISGPLYSIYYQKNGAAPMNAGVMFGGFVIDLLAALLAATLLSGAASGCCRSYPKRVGFVSGLGVFVGLVGHASYWNWMHFPAGYTLAFIIDNVVGWTLAGLVIAAIVRPTQPAGADGNATSEN